MTSKGSFCLTTPHLISIDHKGREGEFRAACRDVSDPLSTVTQENRHALIGATLIQTGYGEREGQAPRVPGLDKPLGTVVAGGVKHALTTASLIKLRGTNVGSEADTPLHTISAQGQHHALMSASLIKYYSEGGQHSGVNEPMHTVTAKARMGLQAVHLQQYNGCSEAQPADEPLPTVPTRDRFGIAAATLCQYNGASECQPLDEPTPTLLGQNKMGLVECPLEENTGNYEKVREFLRLWGVIGPDDEAEVIIDGVRLRINDIGLRMLRPRELFTANGFPLSYNIAPIYKGKPLTTTSQVKKCGNSVPPQPVEEILGANADALDYERDTYKTFMPLFTQNTFPVMQAGSGR